MPSRDDERVKKRRSQTDDQGKKEPGIHNDHSFFNKFNFSVWYFIGLVIIIIFLNSLFSFESDEQSVAYNEFKNMIRDGEIEQVRIEEDSYIGYPSPQETVTDGLPEVTGKAYRTYRVDDPDFIPLLDEHEVDYYAVPAEEPGFLTTLIGWILPFVIMILVWQYIFSRMGRGGAQGVMSFSQNKSKIVAEGDTNVRFSDVAGAEESKQELAEVVDFLKEPQRYTEVGGKIPKGVLLVGPTGTGKTLLAKAVAGEAGVPFFRLNGADFVEMFVGVGAARVRDLFRQAREKSPCIIFIDEIDAIGKTRGVNVSGNDEREQTLNQLLVEMDGFDSRVGVILIGATNRPEILDPALLRPGRFDRQVLVDKPDLEGRVAILRIHTRGVNMSEDVDLRSVAQSTAGLSGADLENIVNEAALLAVRAGRKKVTQTDFSEAIEKAIAGLERKGRLMNPTERKRVAFHETGHALSAFYNEGADQVMKISIVPRGIGALGYTLQQPTEDRYLLSESELLKSINILLGGRAAEEIIFQEISTGAANDISKASDLVRRMITEYGMSRDFRNVTLPTGQRQTTLGITQGGQREYSEDTQQYIDQETARIINEQYNKVRELLTEKQEILQFIAQELLQVESIEGQRFKELIEQYESQSGETSQQ